MDYWWITTEADDIWDLIFLEYNWWIITEDADDWDLTDICIPVSIKLFH